MAVDFKGLLSKRVDDVKKPKPLPAGTYNGIVTAFTYGESTQKQTPYVKYTCKIHSAQDDVDEADLEGIDLSKKELNVTFYLTQDAEWRVVEFIKSCGVDTSGRALGECIPDVVQASVILAVTQRMSKDGVDTFNDVAKAVGEAGAA